MVAIGERLTISPRGIPVRVRGLHAQNHAIDTARAGERCAVNIVGSFPGGREPKRGDWLVAPERHLPVRRLDLFMRASGMRKRRCAMGCRSTSISAPRTWSACAVLSERAIDPGQTGFVQIDLEQPIGALHGDRAVLRDHAARTTLAGGRVVDPLSPRRGRRLPERLALLEAMSPDDPATALDRMLAVAGVVDLAQFALLRI